MNENIALARRALESTGKMIRERGEEFTARLLCEVALGITQGFSQDERESARRVGLEEIFSVNYHEHQLTLSDVERLHHRLQNGDLISSINFDITNSNFLFADTEYACHCPACDN